MALQHPSSSDRNRHTLGVTSTPRSPLRIAELERDGYPCYTTSAGWLGYSDEKLRRLCQEAVDSGYPHVKLRVGGNLGDDIRRCRIAREVIGPDAKLMIDANQVWDVDQAIEWVHALAEFEPHWVEEPTSPDDILGHATIRRTIAPIGVATGEHGMNRVLFKQMFQADAIDFCQLDSARLASINEILAVYLLASKFGIPVCPHAGGVGLYELVQHLSIFDYVAVSGSLENLSRDGIRRSLEESLQRLGLDRIDIAYLHDPDEHGAQAHAKAIPALIELRDKGLVRAIGAGMNQSVMPADSIRRRDVDVIRLVGRYTLLEQGALDDLLPLAATRKIGIVAAAVYNSGLLSRPRPAADALYDYEHAPRELVARAAVIADVCEEFGTTLPEAAIAYPLRHPAVTSVVVGMRTGDQVSSTVPKYECRIPDEFWTALDDRGLVRRS